MSRFLVLGMGAAADEHGLLIDEDAKVQPWKKFAEVFGKDEAATYSQLLQDKLHRLSMVLDAAFQLLTGAPDDATSYTLSVKNLSSGDMTTAKQLSLLVMLQQPVDGEFAVSLKWRRLKLSFDR